MMKRSAGTLLAASLISFSAPFCGLAAAAPLAAPADAAPTWELVVSPYTHHWHHDEEHRHVVLLGLERIERNGSLWGGAVFRNSFGQTSGYVYYGHEWNALFGSAFYAKLTGGVIYGYRGKYKDKVPYNRGGFSPALVPALGYRLTPSDALQVSVLGKAGVLLSYNRRF